MATSFRRSFPYIKRHSGVWDAGRYLLADTEDPPVLIPMTIQMPSVRDLNMIQAAPWGRRSADYIKIYSDVRMSPVSQEPNGSPGDMVEYDGKRFLVVGESDFTMLGQTRPASPVKHWRYFAVCVIEHGPGENVP